MDDTKIPNPSWDLDHQISVENPNNNTDHNSENTLGREPSQALWWNDLQTILPPAPATSKLDFPSSSRRNTKDDYEEESEEELGAMKEMMYKIAAMQPVEVDPATIRKPKRRNVRISDDPQSVAARHRREKISEKIRILQRLVPGGTKMDTASMLEEAIRYVKFLKRQIRLLQSNNTQVAPGSAAGDINNPLCSFNNDNKVIISD